ncbi:hypothetical protein [Sphingomonas sp.]|uniref:hypothetical protein n=1 Tax=Sphingomonas sp. TaxID=28214 RepID=UPI002DD64601|nr:hypothetical protein [Sphingomonas sp.]
MAGKKIGGVIGAALLLASCGGGTGDATGGNATATADAPATGAMPAGWKATDACSVIDKAAMSEVLGRPVTETSLALVHEPTPGGSDAGTSECTYMLDGGRATVMTRWSPINDNTDGAINTARSTMKQTLAAFGGGEVEDIAGLGKASIWVGKVNQLQTFIGEDRMVLITVPTGADAKDKAIALARKAGA